MFAVLFEHVLVLFFLCQIIYVNADRIVGGYDAEEGAFPYQVSLRIKGRHFCGGSILNERWILTAAHCIDGKNSSKISAVVGTTLLNSGGDTYPIKELIPHHLYLWATITNDIALMKVDGQIKFTSKVKPVKVPTENTPEGTELLLSGWGTTSYQGAIPNKLQAIKLLSVNDFLCFVQHPFGGITFSTICTLTKAGEGACHGDSGGPLVHNDKQVGIVSWGIPCAKGKPDVFTRVYSYVDWINKTVAESN